MRFDHVAVLDWSAASTPKRGRDSIWLGVAGPDGVQAENLPTRALAADRLGALVQQVLAQGQRLLLACDLSFGFPAGFAPVVAGQPHALAVWDWLARHIRDDVSNRHNLRDVAALANARFDGDGAVLGQWREGRCARPATPQTCLARRAGRVSADRTSVARAQGLNPKSSWQLAGAGAVGAQNLVGLPILARLRAAVRRCGRCLAVRAPRHPHRAGRNLYRAGR